MITVQGVGRLASEPQSRGESQEVCTFSLASSVPFKGNDGKYKTEFLRCVAFGTNAKNIAKYLQKGSMVYFQAYPFTNEYERDGEKRQSLQYNITEIEFLSSKSDRNNEVDR